ncbi:MAG: elongation factor P [Candidatus Shikimatogenerans sp. Tduv]|uniref:Elongation factor P n=1 Tax=Candidatus Shikimatogenerans sp. Tduv TaxID=3158567 RepID=A0AAU7QR31_9FLAO
MIKINYLRINNILYKVINFLHIKPGKGLAFIKLKLKNILNGNIINYNISSKKKITNIKVINNEYTYLYNKNNIYYFMDKKYNIFNIENKNNNLNNFFYKEGDKVNIFFELYNNIKKFLFIKHPKYIITKVIKINILKFEKYNNDNYMYSLLDNKLIIKTPIFIKINDYIKIDYLKKKYIKRIKKIK